VAMRIGGYDLGYRIRRSARTSGRGLLQALLSQVVCIPLFIFSVLSIAFVALGVGLLTTPTVLLTLRRFAEQERRWAFEWSGVRIASPYRPCPQPLLVADGRPAAGVVGRIRLSRWLLGDPATWRDLLWCLVNAPVGLVLGLLPACLVAQGLEGIVAAPLTFIYFNDGVQYWPIALVVGVVALTVEPYVGRRLITAHAHFCAALLAPTRRALTARVGELTETRAQVVDASAAELRRIERDLHDGAQARLAALGMNIGLAEQMVREQPDLAVELLAEARASSGQALAELRSLVRGIHPPVLAERGLEGAVRALAFTLPMPVDVHFALTDRLGAPQESAVYFAIAEAFANVVKHSGAQRAWVQVDMRDEQDARNRRLIAVVGDDGTGGADPAAGSGLRGIERRLAAFDGILAVTSPPGGPTSVTVELPCASS
jgi:signal transduction histidine kinase